MVNPWTERKANSSMTKPVSLTSTPSPPPQTSSHDSPLSSRCTFSASSIWTLSSPVARYPEHGAYMLRTMQSGAASSIVEPNGLSTSPAPGSLPPQPGASHMSPPSPLDFPLSPLIGGSSTSPGPSSRTAGSMVKARWRRYLATPIGRFHVRLRLIETDVTPAYTVSNSIPGG